MFEGQFEYKQQKFTAENPCPLCGFPVDVRAHDPEICSNVKEEERIKEEEESAKSTIDFIKEKEAISKAYVFEEEEEGARGKELPIGKKEKVIVQEKEKKEPLPKNIQIAIGHTQDFFQREIDFGTRYTKSAIIDDWSERQVSNWLEKSLCRTFENMTEKTGITENDHLIEIARELKISAPERIKNIFYNSVLPEYIRRLRE